MRDAEPVIATCGKSKWDVLMEAVIVAAVMVFDLVQLTASMLHERYGESAFVVVFACIPVGFAYAYGWRQPYRVELTGTTVRWRAPFRQVEVPLPSVRRVHLAWSRNKAKKLVIDGPRPGRTRNLPLHELRNIDPFLSCLLAAAPGIEVRASPLVLQQRHL